MDDSKEHKPEPVDHVDVSVVDQQHQGNSKDGKVFSVALTDAVTKDNVSMRSRSIIKLYIIMSVVTLGTLMSSPLPGPPEIHWSQPVTAHV